VIVLDTDVISALMRPSQNSAVVAWLDRQETNAIRITTVSLHEITRGIELAPTGKKKAIVQSGLDALLQGGFGKHILPLDAAAAKLSAQARVNSERASGYCEVPDALIAGIALAHGASVATRNISHFKHFGVPLVNPLA
jgi:toxin FitB